MSKLFAKFSVLLFAAALLFGCGPRAFLIRSVPQDQSLTETQVQRDEGLFVFDKIAVIDVDGMMINSRTGSMFQDGENPVSLFLEKLDKARRDEYVKAVVLRLNSPGGTVSASDTMHHALLDFKAKTDKPVVACMLDLAASGAYYLACGADGIMAQPTTVTGSIGVIMQTFSVAGTMDKLGIKTVAIKSGDLKDIASPFHDLRPDEREVLEGLVNSFYENFLTVVLDGRKNLTRPQLLQLANGSVYNADQAQKDGLIDRIGYLSDAVDWAKKLSHTPRARTVIYHRPIDYAPNIYATAEKDITAGALINVELPQWLKLEGPQFLYLWLPGVLTNDK